MAASIKTVLKIDDTELKAKLDSVNKYYKQTFNAWASDTAKLASKDKLLVDQKKLLAQAMHRVATEKAKGAAGDKEVIRSQQRLAAQIKDTIKAYKEERAAVSAGIRGKKAEMSALQAGIAQFSKEADQIERNGKARGRSTETVSAHEKQMAKLANTTIRYLRWAGTIAGTVYAANRAWDLTLGKGVEVNRMMEDNTFGIAAIISANTQMVLSNGKVVTSYEKFQMGQTMAKKTMEDLRSASVETYATFPQLTEIFQQAIGQTESMGDSFGTTVEGIIQNTISLSQRMSNIAGAIGMPMDRVREEIRSLLSGNASTDSLISTMLFGSPSQANKAIRDAKSRGENGVKDLLDKVLAPFDAMKGVDSYTRSLLKFQNAWDTAMADASKPVFKDLSAGFETAAKYIEGHTKDITAAIESAYNGGKMLVGVLDELAIGFAMYKTVGLASRAYMGFTASLVTARAATEGLTAATHAQNLAMKAGMLLNPWTAWIVGATAAIAATNMVMDNIREKSEKQHADWLVKAKQAEDDLILARKEALDKRAVQAQEAISHLEGLQAKAGGNKTLYDAYAESISRLRGEIKSAVAESKALEGKVGEITGARAADQNLKVLEARATLMTKIRVDAGLIEKREKENYKAQEKIAIAKAEIAKNNKEILQIEKLYASSVMQENKNEALRMKQVLLDNNLVQMKIIEDERSKAAIKRIKDENEYQRQVIRTKNAKDQVNGVENAKIELLQQQVIEEFDILEVTKGKLARLKQEEKAYDAILALQKAITDEETKRDNKAVVRAKRDMGHTVSALGTQFSEGDFNTAVAAEIKTYEATLATLNDKNGQAAQDLETKFVDAMTAINEKFTASEQEWSDTLNDSTVSALDGQIALIEATKDWNSGLEGVAGTFGTISNSIAAMSVLELKYEKERIQLAKKRDKAVKEAAKKGKDTAEIEANYVSNLDKLKYQSTQNQLNAYGEISGAMASLYDDGSKQANAFQEIQKGVAILSGVTAILEQAKGDPYTSFARMAMMAATVASTLAIAGVSFGGGGGGGSVSKDSFAAQAENTGRGTVLGDAEAQSESMVNSMELLADFAAPQYRVLYQMQASLISIDQKMGGVASLLVRSSGFAFGEGFVGGSSLSNIYVDNPKLAQGAFNSFLAGTGLGASELIANKLGLKSGSDMVGKVSNKLLGGKTSTELADSGLAFDSQSLADAIDGVSGRSYQITKKTKSGGLLRKKKTSYNTAYQSLSDETNSQFSLVISDMYDSILMAGDALGVSTEGLLEDFQVNLGKISLKGKTGDQITEQLQAVFGKVFDEMAGSAFELLPEFQRIGEGLGETMVRVATGMQEANFYIDRLGRAYDNVSYDEIINTQGEVGLEALRQSIVQFDEAMYGASNGVVDLLESVTSSAGELYDMYIQLSTIRDQIGFIGQDTGGLTQSMIVGAGSVGALQSGMDTFFENFLTEGEQLAFKTEQMAKEFDKLGVQMPTSAAAFRSLIESVDLSTDAGQELYGRLILLSNGMADITETLTDAKAQLDAAYLSSYSGLTMLQQTAYASALAAESMLPGSNLNPVDMAKLALDTARASATRDEDLAPLFANWVAALKAQSAESTLTDVVSAVQDNGVLLNDIILKVERIEQVLP